MSKLTEVRRRNIRALIEEQRGGLSRLSKAMGYKNPSFLSQMLGPEPTREVTEKTARKVELVLGLEVGSLDRPGGPPAAGSAPEAAEPGTVSLVADVIRVVGSACEEAGINPGPMKFADLVALALTDSMERGQARPEHVRQLVRLLK